MSKSNPRNSGMFALLHLVGNTERTDARDAGEPVPEWFRSIKQDTSGRYRHVRVREWEDAEWRNTHGWVGSDLCHNPRGRAVRILDYYFDEKEERLIGCVHFGPDAEGNFGVCHGGAMTSVLDDVLGWTCFVTGDGPWNGCTAQVNCKLRKPVPVGSYLRVTGEIAKQPEGVPSKKSKSRKVNVIGKLDNGIDSQQGTSGAAPSGAVVYAELEGLSIGGVKIATGNDAVADRRWTRPDPETLSSETCRW